MSGGRFDYDQYRIGPIADSIENTISKNGRKKDKNELDSWYDSDYYKNHPDELYHYKYPDEVIEKFKDGVKYLRIAQIYAQRIDYLLSGDDGESSFLRRLEEDLKKLEYKEKQND